MGESSTPGAGIGSIIRAVLCILAGAVLCLLAGAGCSREVAGGRADGAAVFAEVCARCHGYEGVPSRAMVLQLKVPNLTQAEFHERMSDADIRARIAGGSPSRGMPGFAGNLTEAQMDALVRHVRTLRK